MTPISVEVIAPVLTDLRHCSHCEVIFAQTEVGPQVHKEVLDEYPLDLKAVSYTHLTLPTILLV